jgi:hypothetical protein
VAAACSSMTTVLLQSNRQSRVTRVPVDGELWWFVTRHPAVCRIFQVVCHSKNRCSHAKKLILARFLSNLSIFFRPLRKNLAVVEVSNWKNESHVTPPVDLYRTAANVSSKNLFQSCGLMRLGFLPSLAQFVLFAQLAGEGYIILAWSTG